jgi:hypothetical protein
VLPDHKACLVVSFQGNFFIDHVHPFGATPATSNAGQISNAAIDIWQHKSGFDNCLFKYEYDINNFCFPNSLGHFSDGHFHYLHDCNSSMKLIENLGIPWHLEKTGSQFLPSSTYIGFFWDLTHCRVSLPDKKCQKYLARISTLLAGAASSQRFFLHDIQVIHGTLVHVSFVVPEGSSHLPAISSFMTNFHGNKFVLHHLSDGVIKSLHWWERQLLDTSSYRQLHPIQPLVDYGILVDASTSWGIGIIIGDFWHAFQLSPGWKTPGCDICWLETIALELVFYFLQQLNFKESHILVHSDNDGAIGAHSKGHSRNTHINLSVRRSYTPWQNNSSSLNTLIFLLLKTVLTQSCVEFQVHLHTFTSPGNLNCLLNWWMSSVMSDNTRTTASCEVVSNRFGVSIIRNPPPRISLLEKSPWSPLSRSSDPYVSIIPNSPAHTCIHNEQKFPYVSIIPKSPSPTSPTLLSPCHAAVLSLPPRDACNPLPNNSWAPSPLQPVVPADCHLILWNTPHSVALQNSLDAEISSHLQTEVFKQLLAASTLSTRETYGAGLLQFTQFCDHEEITEALHMPASPILLSAFIADAIGSCTGECIKNWLNGLRLWHIFNHAEW